MVSDRTGAKPESFSCCGIDCSTCDLFKATVHADAEAFQRAHAVWTKTAQEHWGMQTLDPAILKCRGCRAKGAEDFKGCLHCPMRRCAKEKGLTSCGLCPGWRDCEKLCHIFAVYPQGRQNLEQVEAGLKQGKP